MKKLITVLLFTSLFIACKTDKKETDTVQSEPVLDFVPISDEVIETAVIYEANIRQYSPEGTFDAFTKDIPQLKELGVKIIWLMPIYPISETNRKATGGADSKFASDFPEDEQAKYLGSYYAVSDYTKVNPEFGNIENFRELVKTAHDHGMYVILDWVPNHTGWDHVWIKEHPDWYTQKDGQIIHPEGTDWTDTADLNYDNPDMRQQMITDMMYWVSEENVDGFRCDVAGSVPTDFWEQAIPQLRSEKDIFMLAEAWEPELLKDDLFDMCYAWEGHHLMNDLAKGEKGLDDFEAYMKKMSEQYESDDILMNFVTNHDENSWNGTVKERMGDASELMTAFSYMLPGMPLIYSGQEYGLDHRLKFFEKDSIPKTKGSMWELLEKLGELKNENKALNSGKQDSGMFISWWKENDDLILERKKEDHSVLFVGNLSDKPNEITLPKQGDFLDYLKGETVQLKGDAFELGPWEYKILIPEKATE